MSLFRHISPFPLCAQPILIHPGLNMLPEYTISGVPNLWDIMPNDLKCSDVITTEEKCTINVIHLDHPQTIPCPSPWKTCLLQIGSLVPKRLGTAVSYDALPGPHFMTFSIRRSPFLSLRRTLIVTS